MNKAEKLLSIHEEKEKASGVDRHMLLIIKQSAQKALDSLDKMADTAELKRDVDDLAKIMKLRKYGGPDKIAGTAHKLIKSCNSLKKELHQMIDKIASL